MSKVEMESHLAISANARWMMNKRIPGSHAAS